MVAVQSCFGRFVEQPPDSGTERAKEKGPAAMRGLDFNAEFRLPDLSSNQGPTDCQSIVQCQH